MLRLIWDASLILSGTALGAMTILVISRVLSTRRRTYQLALRRRLSPLLLGDAPVSPEVLRDIPDGVITQLTLDLIQLVRGDERAAFIEKATALGVPQKLMRQSRSFSTRRRMAAVQGLAMFEDDESRTALRQALSDRDDDIRLAAALALAVGDNPPDLRELVSRLAIRDGHSSLLTISLFRHFAKTAPDQVQALVLDPGQPLAIRLAAIEALAESGDYRLVPAIAEMGLGAAEGSEELPRYIHALGKLGHPAAREAILAGMTSQSMAVRVAAAGAAGKIELVEGADQLVTLLDASEWWVRFRAAEALLHLGPPGIARLREAMGSTSERTREAASTMLAEQGIAP